MGHIEVTGSNLAWITPASAVQMGKTETMATCTVFAVQTDKTSNIRDLKPQRLFTIHSGAVMIVLYVNSNVTNIRKVM